MGTPDRPTARPGDVLADTSAMLRAVIDSVIDPYVWLTAVEGDDGSIIDFQYVEANAAACEYIGLPYDEVMGSCLLDLFPWHRESGVFAAFVAVIEHGRSLELNDWSYARDPNRGAAGRYEIRAAPVGNGLSCSWRDVTARAVQAEALAESEARYRLLAENSSDVVVEVGVDGTFRWISSSVHRVFGWRPEQLIGTSSARVVHPDDLAHVNAIRRSLLHGARLESFECRFVGPSGAAKWMSVRGHAIRDDDGSIRSAVVGLRDISSEVEARERLRASEERYRLLAEHSADAVGMFRPDGYCEWATPTMIARYGLDPDEPLGLRPWEYVHEDDRAVAVARLIEVATTGEPMTPFELRLSEPDGSYRWGSVTAERVGGPGSNIVVAFRDIDDEVRAREELVRSAAEFRALAEGSADLIMRLDEDRTLRYVSPAITTLFGWDPSEWVGRNGAEMWHPDDVELTAEVVARLRAGGALEPFCGRLRCKDGSYRWVEARPTLLPATADLPAAFVTVIRDIQDQFDAQAALARSAAEFRAMAEASADVITRSGVDRVLQYVSPAVEPLFGWEPDELIGAYAPSLWHPDDLAGAEETRRLGLTGESRWFRGRLRCKDGSYRWCESRPTFVPATDDRPAVIVSVLRDVHEQELAERALAESEERYRLMAEALSESEEHFRLLVENATGVVYQSGADGRLRWVSPTVTAVLGWEPAALIGTVSFELIAPEDRAWLVAVRDAVYAGHEAADFECRYRTADGGVRWMSVHTRPLFTEDGAVDSIVVGLRDIQTEIEARHARAESEERYRLLAENASDMVFRANTAEEWEWVSPSVTSVMGWQPEELLGHAFFEFVHPDDLPGLAGLPERLATGEPQSFEIRFRRADGSYRWTAVRVRPVFDTDGTIVARVGSGIDIQSEVEARVARAESEERYRLLADHASDVVYLTGPDLSVRWIAPTVVRSLGWTPEELLGTRVLDLFHPDDRHVGVEVGDALLAGRGSSAASAGTGSSTSTMSRLRAKDGTYRWMAGAATAFTDDDGAFAGIIVGLKDVTDLVAAQESVTRERDHVQATLDSLLDPHVVVEPVRDESGYIVDFVVLNANDAACAYLRRPAAQIVGWRLDGFIPPDQRAPLDRWFRRAIEQGAPIVLDDVEYPAPLFGSVRRLDVRGVRVGDAVSFSWRDVTDRHEAAEALAESERRYRRLNLELEDLLTNGSVLALRSGTEGRLVWVSGSAPRLLGYSVDQMVGTSITDWLHPDDIASTLDAGRLLRHGGSAGLVRFRLRAIDGSYRTFEGRAFQTPDAEGGGEIVQGTMTDVTEREQAERLRAQLLAVASHELRSPLAFIFASLRLFSAGIVAVDSDKGTELLGRVTATAERLSRIADTLLRLQNLELSDQSIPTESVDVVKVVTEAALSTVTEREVRITIDDRTDGTLRLRVDPDQLTQAVINLTTNAVKHAPDGTPVEVAVSTVRNGMRVEVRDHGAGVAPEDRQVVFQAFHQLQRRDRAAGVGLGLAIVAKIVERHGGRVWVEDPDDGVGARFVFEIGEVPVVPGDFPDHRNDMIGS